MTLTLLNRIRSGGVPLETSLSLLQQTPRSGPQPAQLCVVLGQHESLLLIWWSRKRGEATRTSFLWDCTGSWLVFFCFSSSRHILFRFLHFSGWILYQWISVSWLVLCCYISVLIINTYLLMLIELLNLYKFLSHHVGHGVSDSLYAGKHLSCLCKKCFLPFSCPDYLLLALCHLLPAAYSNICIVIQSDGRWS